MMLEKLIWPVVLQVLAVAVVIAEFILPSLGLLSVAAVALFGFSIYLVFTQVSMMAGFSFVAIDICMIPILLIVGVKLLAASPVTLRRTLDSKEGAQVQPPEWEALIGVSGMTLTALRPSGTAMFNGRRYDVVSRGNFISEGNSVTVISTDGNRIVVRLTENS